MKPQPARGRDVERLLFAYGFTLLRSKGSHRTYGYADKTVIVPWHTGDIASGTLRSIIKQAGLTVEEFNRNI